MRVSLPMYDLPECVEDHEQLWFELSRALRQVGFEDLPLALEWPTDLFELWRSPDLLLSQTCGLPLVSDLAGAVQLVGVPHYGVPGCDGYNYTSALIVAREAPYTSLAELRGGVVGFNERVSQSGYNILRYLVAPLAGGEPFFSHVEETGRHEASIEAVLAGRIDVAAVDAVTLALFRRSRPERAAGLRTLGYTPPTPGLPLITSAYTRSSDLERLRSVLKWLFHSPKLSTVRARLMLTGISFPPETAYQAIVTQAEYAFRLGYPELC